MIISNKVKQDRDRLVIFGTSGEILQITSKSLDDEENLSAWFSFDDILPFLDGKYRFTDYVVVRSKSPFRYEIVKRVVDIRQRNVDSQFIKISTCNDAQVMIYLKDNTVKFAMSEEVKNENQNYIGEETDVQISGMSDHPFFVTVKDKPDFLLTTLKVPFSKLLRGDKVEIILDYNINDISIFTKKFFDTYSLEQ